ncbi:MAG: rRNA maturation RNase YbeY [Gammaproteobacteria bacterium]|nr:rRNA maturation RNase YbeY [Gammaproteobacteria bacterium]
MSSLLSKLDIDIQFSEKIEVQLDHKMIQQVASICFEAVEQPASVCIRIVDEMEMQHLNHTFRGKNAVTNVLAFESDWPEMIKCCHLGDIVACAAVIEREARQQDKSLEAHWVHMIVHGSLHLLGMDHQTEVEAEEMELREILILQQLGYPDPYQTDAPSAKHQMKRK